MRKNGIRGLLGLLVCLAWAGQVPTPVLCPAGQAGLSACVAPATEQETGPVCCAQIAAPDTKPDNSADADCCPGNDARPAREASGGCCCLQAGPSRPVERANPLPQPQVRFVPAVPAVPAPEPEDRELPFPTARPRPHPTEAGASHTPRSPPLS